MGWNYQKDKKLWRAYTTLNRKQVFLGCFDTKVEAKAAFETHRKDHPLPKRVWKPRYVPKRCKYCFQSFQSIRPSHIVCSKPECVNEHRMTVYQADRDNKLKIRKEYEAKHRERFREQARAWARAHPQKYSPEEYRRNYATHRAGYNNYKARKLSLPNTLTRQQLAIMFKAYGQRCAGCNQSFPFLTVDHKVPISKGGPSVIDNVQPLCKKCNSSKWNKIMFAASRLSDKSLYLVEWGETGMVLANGLYTHASEVDLAC